MIEKEHKAEALTITIQDGAIAGQTVPHVHIHIIPRFKDDYLSNDDVYLHLNQKERELAKSLVSEDCKEAAKGAGVDAEERKPRTKEEMAAEAAQYRGLLEQEEWIW